jgi:hypothetical protein
MAEKTMTGPGGAARTMSSEEVMRTFVRGRLGKEPEFVRTLGEDATPVCRLLVVGKARGPASRPPRVLLYLKGAEAERCAFGLHRGDLIQAAGDIGPERPQARHQEVLVSERVKLRARAGGSAGAA